MSTLPKHKTSLLRLPCVSCGRYFRNQSGLTKHRRVQHLQSGQLKHQAHAKLPVPAQPATTSVHDQVDEDTHSSDDVDNSQGDIRSLDDRAGDMDGDIDMASDDVAGEASPRGASGNDTAYHALLNGK